MDFLSLVFIDPKGKSCTIQTKRDEFVRMITRVKIPYFTKMFCNEHNEYSESTANRIIIRDVPFAFAMCEIIRSNIYHSAKSTRPGRIIRRVYCMDFLGMEYLDELNQLVTADIDTKNFKLLHQFVDSKGYNEQLYIDLMTMKLPLDYDCDDFPKELLELMLDKYGHDLLILYSVNTVYIVDPDRCEIIDTFEYTNTDGTKPQIVKVESCITIPVILIQYKSSVILYNLYRKQILTRVCTATGESPLHSACIDPKQNLLYIARGRSIEVYDISAQRIIKSYAIGKIAVQMVISANGKLLVFVTSGQRFRESGKLCVLNLVNGELKHVSNDAPGDFNFVNGSIVYYNSVEQIQTFNCETCEYDLFIDRRNKYVRNFYPKRIIKHPTENIFISLHPQVQYNGLFATYNIFKDWTIKFRNEWHIKSNQVASCCFSYDGKFVYFLDGSYGHPTQIVKIGLFDKCQFNGRNERFDLEKFPPGTTILNVKLGCDLIAEKIQSLLAKN